MSSIDYTRIGGKPLFPNPNIQPLPGPQGYVQGAAGVGGQYAPTGLRGNVAATRAAGRRVATKKRAATATVGGNSLLNNLLKRWAGSLQTPAQQRAAAQAQVQASIDASTRGYQQAYDQEHRQLANQADRAQGFALAMNSLAPEQGALAQQAYNSAAQNIQGLGTGLTGAVQAAQQAEANTAAQGVSSLTGGLGKVTGLDVPGMHNVAQYTGVVLPSTDLYKQAASAYGAGVLRQRAAAGGVENIVQDYMDKQRIAAQDLAEKKSDLQAGRLGKVTEALAPLATNQNQTMATLITGLGLQNTSSNTQSEIQSRQFQDALDALKRGDDSKWKNFQKWLNTQQLGLAKKKTTADVGQTVVKTQATKAGFDPFTPAKGSYPVPGTGPGTANPRQQYAPIPKGAVYDPSSPTHLAIDPATKAAATAKTTAAATAAASKVFDPTKPFKNSYPVPGTNPVTYATIPSGTIYDPSSPTHLKPDPKVIATATAKAKAAAKASAAKQFDPTKPFKNSYPVPNTHPITYATIPSGTIYDPSSPTHLSPDPATITRSKGKGKRPPTPAAIQKDVNQEAARLKSQKAFSTSPFVAPIPQSAHDRFLKNPIRYKPLMPLPQAVSLALKTYFPAYTSGIGLQQATAVVTAALRGTGAYG